MMPTQQKKFKHYALALAITAGLPTLTVKAENRTWDGLNCNSSFANGDCWSGFESPDSDDNAYFSNSALLSDRMVNFLDSSFINNSASISSTGYVWDLGSGAGIYTLNNDLTVESLGGLTVRDGTVNSQNSIINGMLSIEAGGSLRTNGLGYVGHTAGSVGTVTVGGVNALWNVVGGVYVGSNEDSSGTLTVNSGGTVSAEWINASNALSSVTTGATNTDAGGQINVAQLSLSGGATATSFLGVVDRVRSEDANSIEADIASVRGTDSRWDTNTFYVGRSGSGVADVSDGGVIASLSDTIVGYDNGSNGNLIIDAGGTVETNGLGYVGHSEGSTGKVTVGGAGARWDVIGGIYVGGNEAGTGGAGTLTVNSGGTVNAEWINVSNEHSSIATDAGGQINVTELALSGGAAATSFLGLVDNVNSEDAYSIEADRASVRGTGTRWETDTFYVGRSGSGVADVSDGGVIASLSDTIVGYDNGSNGNLIIATGGTVETNRLGYVGHSEGAIGKVTVGGAGARWDVIGGIYIGGNETGTGGSGTLTVNSGGTVSAEWINASNALSSVTTGATNTDAGGQINVAQLTLSGGATATSFFGVVDRVRSEDANSIEADIASVRGTDSRWDTNTFYVGRSGRGVAEVSDNGVIASFSDTIVGFGNGSNGNLIIDAGGTVETNGLGYVGHSEGSTGKVTVGGAGARWDVIGGIYVGGNETGTGGAGTLTVNSGGTVNAEWINVGNELSSITTGAGGQINMTELALSGGAAATSFLGLVDNVNSEDAYSIEADRASVRGTGTRWETDTFYVGRSGSGVADVSDGGVIASLSDTIVGHDNGSNGNLIIAAGGTVETNRLGYVGHSEGAIGKVTVGGAGARWDVIGGIYIGGNETTSGGTGSLIVDNGGTVNAGNAIIWSNGSANIAGGELNIQYDIVNKGQVDLSNSGKLNFEGTLTNNAGGVINLNGGAINNQGALHNSQGGNVNVNADATLSGSIINNGIIKISDGELLTLVGADLSGSGSLLGASELFDTRINPGNSPGTLTFDDTSWDNVELTMDVAALIGGGYDYDSINILGDLTLLSELSINFDLLDGLEFADLIGQSFNFLNVSGGVFDEAGNAIDFDSWAITLVDGWTAKWFSDNDGWHLALNAYNTSGQGDPTIDVPEPSSIFLMLLAASSLFYQRKKALWQRH